MVERNYFRMINEREASQYKFDFCRDCLFYECELVEEYTQFRKDHAQIQKPKSPMTIVSTDSIDYTKNDNVTIVPASVIVIDNDNERDWDNEIFFHATDNDSSDEDILSYDQLKLKDGCFMKFPHVYQIECGRKNVTDGIGDHYKIEITEELKKDCLSWEKIIKEGTTDRWEPAQPVFISAQTGQGKNWFIENILIPYIKELNYQNKTDYKVLIISNRRALECQIKNRLSGKTELEEGLENEDEIIYSYTDSADVITYQSLLKRKKHFCSVQNQMKSRYIYIICDEAHFFTSDAMFNPHTKEILCSIIETFANAVRIYMSATPYECLPYIIKYEEEYLDKKNYREYYYNQNKWKNGRMIFYHFQRDYSYLEINSYTDIGELYDKIFRSISKNEKWLIFIDDKRKCNSVKEKLEKYIDKASEKSWIAVIDANGKKDKIYQSIVLNEKLDKDILVLIATSVLDNGINLTNIDNIVVSDMSKVKCLQMVGRARISDGNSHKRLYIRRFDKGYVKRRIDNLNNIKDIYHDYDLAYDESYMVMNKKSKYEFLSKYYDGNNEDREKAKHLFWRKGYEPEKLELNEIARSLVEKNLSIYQNIFNEMEEEEKQQEKGEQGKNEIVGQRYLEHQLSWFGKKYCEDDDITFTDKEKAKKKFIAFLEEYAKSGKQILDTSNDGTFRKVFTRLYDTAFGRMERDKRRIYGIDIINKGLERKSINYKVVTHSSYWVVEKCNRQIEDSE